MALAVPHRAGFLTRALAPGQFTAAKAVPRFNVLWHG
jgi:hypothetical protein